MRFWPILLLFPLPAAAGEIYTRDGVTDGDTFYLAPAALTDNDPAYQSWVRYSLMKSTCQLELGGENPARASSFDCEFRSRRHLVEAWQEKTTADPALSDAYLDALVAVEAAGFLDEYTAVYFGKRAWQLPGDLQLDAFKRWRKKELGRHKPVTRITGSWNYRSKVNRSPY